MVRVGAVKPCGVGKFHVTLEQGVAQQHQPVIAEVDFLAKRKAGYAEDASRDLLLPPSLTRSEAVSGCSRARRKADRIEARVLRQPHADVVVQR